MKPTYYLAFLLIAFGCKKVSISATKVPGSQVPKKALVNAISDTMPGEYNIGVYYYPGWKDNDVPWRPYPWNLIKPYPVREPLLSWYKEGEVAIAEQHIQWMHDYGINFVAYDWYWDSTNTAKGEHALTAYLASNNKNLLKFSLLWDNVANAIVNENQYTSMVTYWISNYFSQGQFLKIDGKPVVFIFSPYKFRETAQNFGKTTAQLLQAAENLAIAAGYPGIYFSAGTAGTVGEEFWLDYAKNNGYDGFSAYNYHRGPNINVQSHTYQELSDGYQATWNFVLTKSTLPFIVPMTSGWNKKPWGGSGDTLHDNSVSTPELFEQHLLRARTLIDQNPVRTMKMGIICAWNEFGEGSYIEPTKFYQFQYLEKVKKVFDAYNITLKGSNGKYINSHNGLSAMTCDSIAPQTFTVFDAGGGKVALRCMGKYVSSENGNQPMTCNRTTVGDWEKFDLITNTDGTISLKGNNGLYVSSENGAAPVTCSRTIISGWEKFSL